MKYKTIPLSIIIGEAFSDMNLDSEERNMHVLKRQAHDVLREISTTEQLIHKIQLLSTDRHGRISLPDDFKSLDHVAYRLRKDKDDCTSRETVKEWVQKAYSCSEEEFDVKIDVMGDECLSESCIASTPITVDVDFAWMKSHPFYYDPSRMAVPRNSTDDIHRNTSYLSDRFKLMSYAGDNFFRLHYHMSPNCENLNCIGCSYKYSIQLPYILTDLPKDTEVLLSYNAELTDESGDLLCPDQPDSVEAIKELVLAKYFRVKFLETADKKYMFFYQDADARGQAAIGRAKSVLGTPEYQKLRTFLSETWLKRVRNTSPVGSISGRDKVYQNHLK